MQAFSCGSTFCAGHYFMNDPQECSKEGKILGCWPVHIPENTEITGLAMTDSNEVFLTGASNIC